MFCIIFQSLSLYAQDHLSSITQGNKKEKYLYLTIKYGQGGFQDKRSPIEKLGGGQLSVAVQHKNYLLAIMLSGEYYTNSAAPTHPYEISDMWVLSLFYSVYFLKKERLNLFTGLGSGSMNVPQNPYKNESSILFASELGVNYRFWWKFGVYGTYKYLYAKKDN
jgi:hypothetical protein